MNEKTLEDDPWRQMRIAKYRMDSRPLGHWPETPSGKRPGQ
jgi:hypothetical protein